MAQEVFVYPRTVIDSDNIFVGPIQVPANGTEAAETTVLSYQVKPGKRCRMVVVANDVDSGGIGTVFFTLRINGQRVANYDRSPNQWSSPQLITRLPVPIEVPQLAIVSITAYNSSGTNYNAFGRVLFEYEDF